MWQCDMCNAWNSVVEEVIAKRSDTKVTVPNNFFKSIEIAERQADFTENRHITK